ncbi:FCD domain-containing protein [Pseudonocardia spinosispora]|uniref:FCD domain-containing protein n=1 Tax=Pseudonocardia spinosispora TaxID=103441 RepID=UPI000491E4BF|nr:FCD domain-containing protein [Pseudonocardia spinosispora]
MTLYLVPPLAKDSPTADPPGPLTSPRAWGITGGTGSWVAAVARQSPDGERREGLTQQDIHAIFQLLRRIEPALARRSAVSLSSEHLDRVERNADLIASLRFSPTEVNQLYTALRGGLIVPGVSHIETSTVVPLQHRVTAHFEAHYRRLGTHPKELSGCDDTNERLIAAFRTRDPDVASAAVRDHLDGCEFFALHVLNLG